MAWRPRLRQVPAAPGARTGCGTARRRCWPRGATPWNPRWPGGPGSGRCQRLLVRELGVVQLGVQAAGGEQFLVLAALADLAVVDDQDLVGLPDGGQPVRDDQGRP